jgi:hypothetical protein
MIAPIPNILSHIFRPTKFSTMSLAWPSTKLWRDTLGPPNPLRRPTAAEALAHPWLATAPPHAEVEVDVDDTQVRKTPSWPRSWANCSLL